MKSSVKLISIIIPCYNDGAFLVEAIESIALHDNSDKIEVIIVNDGSTDRLTLSKLSEFSTSGICVIDQENSGLAAARNAGIALSNGKYILPLDCDNKIVPAVFLEAAQIMEMDPNVDMVYTDAYYFGQSNGEWIVGPVDGKKLLIDNYIDACTLIRKESIIELGMYDTSMPFMGHEDWDLWVNFYLNNKNIVYLPKLGFYYRVRPDSMSIITSTPNRDSNKFHIYMKHPDLITKKIYRLDEQINMLNKKIESFERYTKERKVKAILKILLGKKIVY